MGVCISTCAFDGLSYQFGPTTSCTRNEPISSRETFAQIREVVKDHCFAPKAYVLASEKLKFQDTF